MLPSRDGEDLVQFFQSQGFSLRYEEQDQDPANQTPCRVPAERALWFKGGQEVRPGE